METRVFSDLRKAQTVAIATKEKLKSPMRWFLLLAILLMPTVSIGQVKASADGKDGQKEYVKFVAVSATKTYPEGNQITYVEATGLPTEKLVVDKMKEHLIKMMRVTRVYVYLNTDLGLFMFDGDEDIKPEWVVDEMNVFLRRYYAEMNQEKE